MSTQAGNLFAKVLYRRIPVTAPAASAKAAAVTEASIAASTVTFGRSSVSVKTRSSASGSLFSAPAPGYETAVVRWILIDDRIGETWTMYLNPNEMTGPPATRNYSRGTTLRNTDRMASMETPVEIQPWSFGGVILTKEHYLKLEEWALKPGSIRVRDHLGRIFKVLIESFVPHEKPGRAPDDWKMTYTMNTQYLRRLK